MSVPANKNLIIGFVVSLLYVSLFFVLGAHTALINFTDTPPGQWAYILSKWLGLWGLSLLIAQFLSLLISVVDRSARSHFAGSQTHKVFSLLLVFTALAHIAFFMLGAGLRQQHIDWQVLLPVFSHGHYRSMLSLGVVALLSLVMIVSTGIAIGRSYSQILNGRWRNLLRQVHRMMSLVLIVATVYHSFSTGSETRSPSVLLILLLLILTVMICLVQTHKRASVND